MALVKPWPVRVMVWPVLADGLAGLPALPLAACAVMPVKTLAGCAGKLAGSCAVPPSVVMRIGPSRVRGATTVMLSFLAPVTSKGVRLVALSVKVTPPMVTLEAPSMKPEPMRLKESSSPGRPLMRPVRVGTICSRRPGLARKDWALSTAVTLDRVSRSLLTPSTLTSIRSGPAPALVLLPSQLSSTSRSKLRV